jgi:hypothetical protein
MPTITLPADLPTNGLSIAWFRGWTLARRSVFSPSGPSGAHGFRNTGAEPLQILFVYPSANSAQPELHWVYPDVAAALDSVR